MELMSFIPSQLGILIAVLYVLGYAMKNVSIIKDEYIPVILIVFSIVFSILLVGLSATAFLQGILCWGVSVGINQTYKQINKIGNDESGE